MQRKCNVEVRTILFNDFTEKGKTSSNFCRLYHITHYTSTFQKKTIFKRKVNSHIGSHAPGFWLAVTYSLTNGLIWNSY